jgi:HD-GYP domain-containing protein (c-di-GMP phosphodiesterase class II)
MPHKSKNNAPEYNNPPEGMNNLLDYHLDASKILTPAPDGTETSYSPLPLRNLAPGMTMPFNVYIKCKPKGHNQAEYFLCCSKGQVFKGDWHRKLEKLKVPWVYFPLRESDSVLECLHHNLKELNPKACAIDQELAAQVMDAMLVWIQHFYLTEAARTGPNLEMALDFIDLLFGFMKRSKASLSFIVEMQQHDDYLFRHCLNVCVIGLAFMSYLGLAEKKARAFGVGALLHDVGMIQVPRDILQKTARLNEDDLNIIRRHPQQSYAMLKNLTFISRESILMVQQHHENGDGSGYPMALTGSATHPWAKIIRVIDSYESVTSGRPWRAARSPKDTLWAMRTEWEESQVYDPAFLRAFIKFLGGHD